MIVARNPATAWRVIEGEAVILSMESKTLRGLNAVGSRVWELIDGHRTVDDIAAVVAREFEVPTPVVARDVRAFIDQLLAKGLVAPVP